MGYITEFDGSVVVEPPLNQTEIAYLSLFAGTRRMDREKGPYFVHGTGDFGQGGDPDIRNFNQPAEGQPSLWCQWVPTDDGTAIEWDGGEKFYGAEEWMRYLIDHFLRPGACATSHPGFEGFTFDHVVNGTIHASGEDRDDVWDLIVTGNQVTTVAYKLVPDQSPS